MIPVADLAIDAARAPTPGPDPREPGEPARRRLTGEFASRSLEARHQAENFERSVKGFTRFSLTLSAVFFLAYGLHDAALMPEIRRDAWAIRYGVAAPIFAGLGLVVFSRHYARYQQAAVLVFGTTICLVDLWIAAIAPPAGYFVNTVFVIMFVILGPFMAKMRVRTQLVYTLVVFALYVALDAALRQEALFVKGSLGATILAMGALAAMAGRQMEAQERDGFLQRDLIRRQFERLEAEKRRSESLLLNVLPASIAERLKTDPREIADGFLDVTVLFSDIVGFTQMSQRLSPAELVRRLNEVFSSFDDLTDELRLEKIKTIGDAYMVVGGLPEHAADHAEAVAEMALRMQACVERFGERVGEPLRVRVGIHTGPAVAGVIGKKKFIYDVWGDTVNTASRMESHGEPGRIQVTEATYARLRGAYAFEPRGEIEVKGKGPMKTYFLVGRAGEARPSSGG